MQSLPLRLSLAVSLAASVIGCGDDGGAGDTEEGTDVSSTGAGATTDSSGTSSSSTDPATSVTSATAAPTTVADGSSTSEGPSGSSSETTGTTSTGACQVWEVTYDLAGSEFEISGTPLMAGDQVNTVQAPYDGDANIGPGSFVLRFQDVEGSPGGLATMVSHEMVMNFVIGGTVTVTTNIEGQAGPEECGITQGLLNGDTIAWAPPQIVDYATVGEVLCEGNLCSLGGLPDGDPVDMSGTTDQPLTDFVFEAGLGSFTMVEVVVDMDNNSTNSWAYTGTETGRELIDAPDCLCR